MTNFIWISLATVTALVGVGLMLRWLHGAKQFRLDRARLLFHQQREHLEARFMTLAAERGVPRGLEWVDCQFDNDYSLAQQLDNGRLCALVGMTIRFEAVEGGDMEDNPNVGALRAATALFQYDGANWSSQGRAFFNLNPAQAVRHFQNKLEMVEGEKPKEA